MREIGTIGVLTTQGVSIGGEIHDKTSAGQDAVGRSRSRGGGRDRGRGSRVIGAAGESSDRPDGSSPAASGSA